jgi:hemoglobin-like flavoprotein
MPLDVELLRKSFAGITRRKPLFTPRFYELFFQHSPAARPLFCRRGLDKQQRMLQDGLAAIVERLDDERWLRETLGALGRKHAEYGVSPEMYEWFAASLLVTLAENAATDWTPDLATAWSEAVRLVVTLMQEGGVQEAGVQEATAVR